MALNLHNVVRGAIQAINADKSVSYYKSTGFVTNSDGSTTPAYAAPTSVKAQIQPPSGEALEHINFLNLQGVFRTIFLYSNPQAINRINVQGGDLLQFPQFTGAPVDNWLVTKVFDTWDVDGGGWSELLVTLQTDRPSMMSYDRDTKTYRLHR